MSGDDEKRKPTLQESLEQMRKNFDTIIQSQATIAILMKARHEALIKAGFTKEEALEIIKARGISV